MSIYQKYCTEIMGANHTLEKIDLHYPEHFNFGYDVVDAIAAQTPNKQALVWCNTEQETHTFPFRRLPVTAIRSQYPAGVGAEAGR